MKGVKNNFASIGEYIALFPADIQAKLRQLRNAIKAAAPRAEERIGYQMPAFALNGPLVYFAAFKEHIGFFPTSSGVEAFRHELAGYETSKGTIKFPLGEPLPLALIGKIVRFRVAENLKKAKKPAKIEGNRRCR